MLLYNNNPKSIAMKHIITALVLTGILTSCNSSDTAKKAIEESPATEITADDRTAFIAIDTDDALIATALMAAPQESRSGCKVIGYNMAGEFVTLKEGTNEFIVLVDNPKQDGFNVACYHKDLEPFMARGRALKAEGKTGKKIFEMREEEMKAGTLNITPGSTLHIYYGPNAMYNPKDSKVDGAKLRYVVYMPWSTSKSTGLPEAPIAANHPWIMNPGTHRAHIMISPLPEDNK
jgi:hypothetical protein